MGDEILCVSRTFQHKTHNKLGRNKSIKIMIFSFIKIGVTILTLMIFNPSTNSFTSTN